MLQWFLIINYNVAEIFPNYTTCCNSKLCSLYIAAHQRAAITFVSKDYYRIRSIGVKRQGLRQRHIQTLPDRMLQTASERFAVLEYEDDNVREIDGI